MRKLIAVTGGSRGIGRAILDTFSKHDFDIVTCSRHEDELINLKDEIEKNSPSRVLYLQADMSERSQVKMFTDFVASLRRPLDVLVNNAGYFLPGELTTEPEGTLESMIGANLYSAYHTTRGLSAIFKEQKYGHIINICSIASIKAYANGGSYAVSKFALLGFSKCLREEMKAFNVRVSSVLPGATKTRSWEGVDLPDERFMKVEDVAETIYSAWSLSGRSVVEEILIRPMLGDI